MIPWIGQEAFRRLDKQAHSISLTDYARQVRPTDRLPVDDLQPVLLGLFGEVGSVMATSKKYRREGAAFAGYRHAAVEEFGDALWYFAALCRRLHIRLDVAFSKAIGTGDFEGVLAAKRAQALGRLARPALDHALFQLGEAAAALLSVVKNPSEVRPLILKFAVSYLEALRAMGMTIGPVVTYNIAKTRGRFLNPSRAALPTFDSDFEAEERIPEHFEITITQRKSGKTYMQWKGVFVGDPLTDNIRDRDGYRFHDVFHFAHAAVLHWSPTFRGLIKHKRKSDPKIDEAQDGGRAIVVEEGLTAWIFSRAKKLGFFEHQTSVSFDMLKTIQEFVSGYEVEACPLKLWEDAILQGYSVFRELKKNEGGTVIANLRSRRITYQPPKGIIKT